MDSAELSFPMVTQSLPPDRSPVKVRMLICFTHTHTYTHTHAHTHTHSLTYPYIHSLTHSFLSSFLPSFPTSLLTLYSVQGYYLPPQDQSSWSGYVWELSVPGGTWCLACLAVAGPPQWGTPHVRSIFYKQHNLAWTQHAVADTHKHNTL